MSPAEEYKFISEVTHANDVWGFRIRPVDR